MEERDDLVTEVVLPSEGGPSDLDLLLDGVDDLPEPVEDNLDAAVADTMRHASLETKRETVGEPGAPATVQLNIRITPEIRERWSEAAAAKRETVSEFVRRVVNAAAAEVLDCPHQDVITYPWSVLCRTCGKRFK